MVSMRLRSRLQNAGNNCPEDLGSSPLGRSHKERWVENRCYRRMIENVQGNRSNIPYARPWLHAQFHAKAFRGTGQTEHARYARALPDQLPVAICCVH